MTIAIVAGITSLVAAEPLGAFIRLTASAIGLVALIQVLLSDTPR